MGYKFFTIAAIALALLSAPAPATTTISFDSSWWSGLSPDEQMVAVEGAMDSYESAFSDGFSKLSDNARSYMDTHIKSQSATNAVSTTMYSALKQLHLPRFSKTFGTYMHGITDFYANHPEASKATIGEIMACLSDIPIKSCDSVARDAANQ